MAVSREFPKLGAKRACRKICMTRYRPQYAATQVIPEIPTAQSFPAAAVWRWIRFWLCSMYTPQKMFLLAFSFANFEMTRGNRGKANTSFLYLLSSSITFPSKKFYLLWIWSNPGLSIIKSIFRLSSSKIHLTWWHEHALFRMITTLPKNSYSSIFKICKWKSEKKLYFGSVYKYIANKWSDCGHSLYQLCLFQV